MQLSEDLFSQRSLIEGEIHCDVGLSGISLKAAVYGIGQNPILAEGTLPFNLSLFPLQVTPQNDQPLKIAVQAEGELGPYLQFFYNEPSNLSGEAKIALSIEGQIDSPTIHGQLDLLDGMYESASTGATYKNVQAHIEADGAKLILTQFSAQDDLQGSLRPTDFSISI